MRYKVLKSLGCLHLTGFSVCVMVKHGLLFPVMLCPKVSLSNVSVAATVDLISVCIAFLLH